MVTTEVWLAVKGGVTVVEDATRAKRQARYRRQPAKKRQSQQQQLQHRKRKRQCLSQFEEPIEDAGAAPEDPNAQLFADAQAQLQLEMAAAGFDHSALPLSFGSTHGEGGTGGRGGGGSKSRKKRKRQSHDEEPTPSGRSPAEPPVVMAKVHVKYDSDGAVADRIVESVASAQRPDNSNSESTDVTAVPVPPSDSTVVAPVSTQEVPTEASEYDDPDAREDPPSSTVDPSSADGVDIDPSVWKFWKQRRTLFYKYDEGIRLDHESWYSVTPQALAEHIATRCAACEVIVDPFSGCGGNAIQFAQRCRQVIAIEIDPVKVAMAQHNARIYGVADRIEWILGDALEILPRLRADAVFLSPPWGGVGYDRKHFRIEEMRIGAVSGVELFAMARRVARNVIYYMPKTTPAAEFEALAPGEAVECERMHLNGQFKVMTAYYGEDLVAHQPEETTDPRGEDGDPGHGEEPPQQPDDHHEGNGSDKELLETNDIEVGEE